jgi:hypothetical protein
MTKNELIKALEDYPDDTDIVLWNWDNNQYKSSMEYLNPACQNREDEKGDEPIFCLLHSRCFKTIK